MFRANKIKADERRIRLESGARHYTNMVCDEKYSLRRQYMNIAAFKDEFDGVYSVPTAPRPDNPYCYSMKDDLTVEQKRPSRWASVKSVLQASTASTDQVLAFIDLQMESGFVDKMLEYIDQKNMKDSQVYKAAQVDRRLFSKIVSDRAYKPAKDTCLALAFALRLSFNEANDLLSRAGYTFSHSSRRDVILEYLFKEQVYNLTEINEILYHLQQKPIGR